MLHQMFKSVIDQDRAAVVICDTEHTIVYMNPAAVQNYANRGGAELVGKSLLACHNEQSNEMIRKIVSWFADSKEHNMIRGCCCKDQQTVFIRFPEFLCNFNPICTIHINVQK